MTILLILNLINPNINSFFISTKSDGLPIATSTSELKHSTYHTEKNQKKRNHCVSLNTNGDNNDESDEITLENLLYSPDDQVLQKVFITMPAKAAGTSLKRFTIECMNHGRNGDGHAGSDLQGKIDNILGHAGKNKTPFLYHQLPNTIITSHLYSDKAFQNMIQNMPYSTVRYDHHNNGGLKTKPKRTRGALLIYVHRDETERLISAIRCIITERVCVKYQRPVAWIKEFNKNMQWSETECIVSEEDVVNAIPKKVDEIGFSGNKILTCNTYKILKENNPLSFFDDDNDGDILDSNSGGVLFMHYSQVDKLQKILAKYHCPGKPMESGIHVNVAGTKPMQVFLKRHDDPKKLVSLNDWLDEKRADLEWTLNLKGSQASCQTTTRRIEKKLYQCPDETMILSNNLL